jgi:L-iditol 2-dehydrogenase
MELVIERPGLVRIGEQRDEPDPRFGEVVVEVRCLSLCGSDYKLFRGEYGGPATYPIYFGHEWSGVIVWATADSPFAVGTEVTGDCSRWCGECDLCQVDKNLCRSVEKFGITVAGFSLQTRAVEARYLYPNTYRLDTQLLALTEVCAVALHGIRKVCPLPSGPIAVIGAGSLGLTLYLLLTQQFGCLDVRLIEQAPEKRELVRRLFPEATFHELPQEPVSSYAAQLADSVYGIAFECAGSADGLNAALRVTERRGTVVCFGLGMPGLVRNSLLVTKGLQLLGSVGGTGEFLGAMKFIAENRALVRRLVTRSYRAADAQMAFEHTLRETNQLKVQLEFVSPCCP